MMRISRISLLCSALFLCLLVVLGKPAGVHADALKFDQGTVTVSAGSSFTLGAMIDAGSDQVTSTDMWIVYDPTLLQAVSASAAAYFPAVTSNISPGKVYIAGLITNPGTYETGAGTVATVTFTALKNGTATVAYDCRTDVSNSSKIIQNSVNATNLISCSANGTSIVTIGTGTAATGVPTQAPVTTSYYSQQVRPTALPQTGIMDALPKIGTMGALFFGAGILLRLLLIL